MTYILQIYPSCDYCDNPAGVIIYKMTPEECESWDVNILPDLVFDRYDGESFISVIDPRGLAKKLKVDMEIDIEGCEDDFYNVFCSAVFDQICANREAQK